MDDKGIKNEEKQPYRLTGVMGAIEGYFDTACYGSETIPLMAESIAAILVLGGLLVAAVLMLPFFLIGLLAKALGHKPFQRGDCI